MNDSKEEEALCNNAQNHRQQLLNHRQDLDRDIEAGSCDADEEDEGTHDEAPEADEGNEGNEEGEEGELVKGAAAADEIPPLYDVEPGCTALGCYSAIATCIVMVIGVVSLVMYSSPPNATAPNLVMADDDVMTTLIAPTLEPELIT